MTKKTALITISTLGFNGFNAFSYQQFVSALTAKGLEKAIDKVRKSLDCEYVITEVQYYN